MATSWCLRWGRSLLQLGDWRGTPFAILLVVMSVVAANASADVGPAFASLYDTSKPFLSAIAAERRPPAAGLHVTGISVPHHLLAADLIARGFRAASGSQYDRVIIVSPDHFSRSRRPMATTRRDIDTVFGFVRNDREATDTLLQMDDLFDNSDLFAKEHGIAALLPFVRHFFPNAKIVPIAISYSATREDCDRALALLGTLVGARTLVVQSTDYSHYLRADIARQRDQETLNIIAANDADAVFRLIQPDHMDSRASQYVQMKLQSGVYNSHGTVIANRNSTHYSAMGDRTTSYVVTVYSERPPTGAELRYPDQEMIYFGGDSFVGRWLTAPLADKKVVAAVVREVRSLTGGAPMVVNLEGVLMDEPPEGIGNDLHVMYAGLAVPILKALNVKVASLANNHSFDLGPPGYQESRAILQKSGIVPLGHKEIVDFGPFRLLGLNFIGKFDYHDYPAVKDEDLAAVCGMKAAPPLLAFVHWGKEYTNAAGPAQYAAAQAMQDCGVGAIVGAHPHRAANAIEALQGGEYAMLYSLGNLLFDQTAERGSGALLELRVFQQGTYAARLMPLPNLFDESIGLMHGQQQEPPQTGHAGAGGGDQGSGNQLGR